MVTKAVVITCASSAIIKDASAVTPNTQFFPTLASLSLRVEDGGLMHFGGAEADDGGGGLANLASFQGFQGGFRECCVELPVFGGVTIVGNYRMQRET